ncbi:MAG: zinc ABC transporter substrate-binding protein [Candidatus Anstonellaceae archaeon]
MNKIFLLFIFFILISSGCIKKEYFKENKLIVVSSYPIYSAVKEIAGEEFDVILLQPPYLNAHFFEPRPSDIVLLSKADVFIYTSPSFDIWVPNVLSNLKFKQDKILLISATNLANLDSGDGVDPHFWLSVKRYKLFSKTVSQSLAEFYPNSKQNILKNEEEFLKKLDQLDKNFENLRNCKKKHIFLTHMAFGYLEQDYNVIQMPLIKSFEPSSSDTSIKHFLNLVKAAKEKNISTIFLEEGYPKKLADVFAKEVNASILHIDTLEYYTPEDLNQKDSYIIKMNKNLENLKRGLECE